MTATWFVLALLGWCAAAQAGGDAAVYRSSLERGEQLEIDARMCSGRNHNYCDEPTVSLWTGTANNNAGPEEELTKEIEIPVPEAAKRNKTMWLHITVKNKAGVTVRGAGRLTHYAYQRYPLRYLLRDPVPVYNYTNRPVVLYWKPKIEVYMMAGAEQYNGSADVPEEIRGYVTGHAGNVYNPLVFVSDLGFSTSDLIWVNSDVKTLPLKIMWKPTSGAKLGWLVAVQQSIKMQESWGAGDKESDDVKRIFVEMPKAVIWLVVFVAVVHIVCDLLALKNDVSFWIRRKGNMEGISVRAVVMNAAMRSVIFFYLMDNDSSLLVLVPMGMSVAIEAWKLTRVYRLGLGARGTLLWFIPRPVQKGAYAQSSTSEFDAQAFKFLNYVLIPSVVVYAMYSLVYVKQRGWYSWALGSLASFTYACGFAMMTPQLFINYKLKTVANLPWRALVYRAASTFIDDLFAWIIKMPTMHRVSCLRDDVVFLIYLYQRHIYPTDASRHGDDDSHAHVDTAATANADADAEKKTQ
eukprot:m51a1_g2400 hypothetical protein (522) ;mRNA; f:761396-763370